MTRQEMIDTLALDCAEACADMTHEELIEHLQDIYTNGIQGYDQLSDEQLQAELSEEEIPRDEVLHALESLLEQVTTEETRVEIQKAINSRKQELTKE